MAALGPSFVESRDENYTWNLNQLAINTNPLALPGPSLNGRNFFTFPRTVGYGSAPPQASGGAGADVIALWTGIPPGSDTFSDATFNPQLGSPAAYWAIANAPTNTAWNMPSGGFYMIQLRVLLSVPVTAGNTATCRIDISLNSGASWINQSQDSVTQSANANPPPISYVNTQIYPLVSAASAAATWVRFVAAANYVTNFTFQITIIRFA